MPSHFKDNGGATTSRQDWVLNVNAVMDGDIAIMKLQLKVQVVATPGRKTKHNGPVAGPSSANTLNGTVTIAVENVRLVRQNLLKNIDTISYAFDRVKKLVSLTAHFK